MNINNRIKFRHLICFLEVANQKSFVKAGNSLGLTQPAVSKAIWELENELGVKLFNRSRSGVSLTYYGEAFRGYAGASKTALEQGVSNIMEAKNQGTSTISIGALPTVAGTLMPRAVLRAREEGLQAKIKLITGPNDHLYSELIKGNLDMVVGRMSNPHHMEGLTFEKLYSDVTIFAVRKDHPLLKKDNLGLSDISNYTVLLPNSNSIIRPDVDRLLVSNGIANLKDVIETVSPTFGMNYVKISDTIWIISRSVVIDQVRDGTLVELPFNTGETTGPIGLTTSTTNLPSISANLITQAIKHSVATAPQ